MLRSMAPIPTSSQRSVRNFWYCVRKLARWLEYQSWTLAFAAASVVILVMASGYYFNRLLLMEQDVKAAWANVEALQSRRNHIRRNLSSLAQYYAQYEQEMMKDVTKMRTDNREPTRGPPSDNPGGGLLGRLNATAEQYPNPQLTNTIQQMTQSTINSETDIANIIIRYNEVTNIYNTALHTFPASIFGRLLGFRDYPLYKPDRNELGFVEMKL